MTNTFRITKVHIGRDCERQYCKGEFTIDTCHLYRLELAEERADQKLLEDIKGSVKAELIAIPKYAKEYIDNRDEFFEHDKDIVKEYKDKNVENI